MGKAESLASTRRAAKIDTALVREEVLVQLEPIKNVQLPQLLAEAKEMHYVPNIKYYQAAIDVFPIAAPILVQEAELVVYGDNFHSEPPQISIPASVEILCYRRQKAGERVYHELHGAAKKYIAENRIGEEDAEYVRQAFNGFGVNYLRHIYKHVDQVAELKLIQPRGASIVE